MSCFAVIRQAGPAWIEGKGAFDQPGVREHSAFMNALAEEGIVLAAGPLAGTELGRIRALLIMDVHSEDEIRTRLADDPWARAQRLVISSIEPWNLFVGADRLAGPRLD